MDVYAGVQPPRYESPYGRAQPETYNSSYTRTETVETPPTRYKSPYNAPPPPPPPKSTSITVNAVPRRVSQPQNEALPLKKSSFQGNFQYSFTHLLEQYQLPKYLYKVDFEVLEAFSPTKLGFQALKSGLPFPSKGDEYSTVYWDHIKQLDFHQTNLNAPILSTPFITLLSSRSLAELEAKKWRKSYGAKYWRVYEISTVIMLELGTKIVKGRGVFYIHDGERRMRIEESKKGQEIHGEFFVWGNILAEAIVTSYGEHSGDTTEEEDEPFTFPEEEEESITIKPQEVKRKIIRLPFKGGLRQKVLKAGTRRKFDDKGAEAKRKK
jgi:hypothetical protein